LEKPGEELQLDVGSFTLPEPHADGRPRRVKVFVFTPNTQTNALRRSKSVHASLWAMVEGARSADLLGFGDR